MTHDTVSTVTAMKAAWRWAMQKWWGGIRSSDKMGGGSYGLVRLDEPGLFQNELRLLLRMLNTVSPG